MAWSGLRNRPPPCDTAIGAITTSRARQDDWKPLFLYRQVQSEAIRLLLPVSTFQAEPKLATFKACLELGLRKKFKGDPGHLIIREQQDPGTGGDRAPRRFLVLYDTVPGGTGYLKEFSRNPQAMRDVLEGAFRTLKSCRCRQQPGVDGCYRCVYAYQRQNELELVSRELGIEMLGEILARWDRLQPVQFLSQVQLPDLLVESELEGRFLTTLEAHQKKHQRPWNKLLRSGKWSYEFEADGGNRWLLEPQVELTASEGVPVACRPDFVLWPQGEQPGALPVAIFTDGFAFHVKPDQPVGGLADDIRKRLGLVRSGRFVVWSLTWDDVDEFTKDEGLPGVGLFLDLGIDRNRLRAVLTKAQSVLTEGFIGWSGLESLLRYLARPEPEHWRKAVAAALLVSTLPRRRHPDPEIPGGRPASPGRAAAVGSGCGRVAVAPGRRHGQPPGEAVRRPVPHRPSRCPRRSSEQAGSWGVRRHAAHRGPAGAAAGRRFPGRVAEKPAHRQPVAVSARVRVDQRRGD